MFATLLRMPTGFQGTLDAATIHNLLRGGQNVPDATASASGLMSTTDKARFDALTDVLPAGDSGLMSGADKTLLDSMLIRLKYILAAANRVHMEHDLDLLALPALLGTEDQATTNTFANTLKTFFLSHFAEVGTLTEDGYHLAADTVNAAILTAVPNASTLNTCITLVVAMVNGINSHLDQTGVHFNPDDSADLTISPDPPTTLAHCRTDLNLIRQYVLDHTARASE